MEPQSSGGTTSEARWETARTDGVVVARFHNPPLNYMTGAGLARFGALVEEWADPEVRAIVIAGGEPGVFITHFSVEELVGSLGQMAERGPELNYRVHAISTALNDLQKPVICALNGDTMGFGFELALSADIRIGQRGDHRYGLPEVRLGLIPGGTGTQRLSRAIGPAAALDLLLRGRVLDPEAALERGLIHELVDDALATAERLAATLAGYPRTALAAAKRIVYQAADLPLASALRMEADAAFRAKVSPEASAAMERYLAVPSVERRGWLEEGA
jgi:enoyl-CoA hydratase